MFDLSGEKASLGLLDLNVEPNPADTWMRVLGPFNQCDIGMIRFQGETPWEIHPDDELLQILEGSVDVTIAEGEARRAFTLHAGQMCIVPANLWHKQSAHAPVSLMYITSRDHSEGAFEAPPGEPPAD